MKFRQAFDAVVLALTIDAGVLAVKAASRRLPAPDAPAAPARWSDKEVGNHQGEASPGVHADTPSAIPAPGWKQIGRRVLTRFGQDRVMAEAASVTYFTLLAIFPAIAALISLYGLVADPATIGKHLDAVAGVVPAGGVQIISDQIHSLTSAPKKGLGIGAVIGLLTSLWSANAGVKSLFDALNAVYEERETRGFVHLTWLSLAFTIGALLFVILALGAVVVVPAVLAFVGLGTIGDTLLSLGRWPVLLVGIMVFLALTYRFGPSRHPVKWRWVTWGSAFASLTWIAGSLGFSYYAANFGNYNKTYGSLGAAVGFMTWIWISTMIVLVGAELNAEIERQTDPEGTVGQDNAAGAKKTAG